MGYIHNIPGWYRQPWFCYLASMPTYPGAAPQAYLKSFFAEPDIDPKRAELVAFIEHLDDGIGRVVDCLKKQGGLKIP